MHACFQYIHAKRCSLVGSSSDLLLWRIALPWAWWLCVAPGLHINARVLSMTWCREGDPPFSPPSCQTCNLSVALLKLYSLYYPWGYSDLRQASLILTEVIVQVEKGRFLNRSWFLMHMSSHGESHETNAKGFYYECSLHAVLPLAAEPVEGRKEEEHMHIIHALTLCCVLPWSMSTVMLIMHHYLNNHARASL